MKILTANRLIDGEAVWYAGNGHWDESIAQAEIAGDKEGEARLEAIGKQASANNELVDAVLIDVETVDGRIVPQRLREKIRAAGPTNRVDLGKQARTQAA